MSRRFIKGQGLRVGLLSDDPTENEETAAPVEPAADSVETELLEVAKADSDVAENEAQTEEAVEVAEGLEAFVLEMKAAQESGGITRHHAATISRIATESLISIGEAPATAARVMPALESFGSAARAMESTALGMESIAESAKNIWKKILAALEKAWNYIRDHFLKLFGAFEKLKKRAAALVARVEANTESKKKESSLEREDIAKALVINKAVDVANIKPLVEISKAVSTNWTAAIGQTGDKIAAYFTDLSSADNKADVDKASAELTGVAIEPPKFGGVAASAADHGYEERSGLKFHITPELPGGKAIYAYVAAATAASGDAAAVAANVTGQVVSVGAFKAKDTTKAPSKIAVLDKAKITELCGEVETICDEMINYKRNANKFSAIEKKISDAAKKLANRAPKGDEPAEVTAALKEAGKLAAKAPGWISGVSAKFYGEAAAATKAFLDWGELSLAQYKAD